MQRQTDALKEQEGHESNERECNAQKLVTAAEVGVVAHVVVGGCHDYQQDGTRHNDTTAITQRTHKITSQRIITINFTTLSITIKNVFIPQYSNCVYSEKCHSAECHFAKCHFAKCHFAKLSFC